MYFYEWVTQTKHQYMDLSFQSSVVLLSLRVQVNRLLVQSQWIAISPPICSQWQEATGWRHNTYQPGFGLPSDPVITLTCWEKAAACNIKIPEPECWIRKQIFLKKKKKKKKSCINTRGKMGYIKAKEQCQFTCKRWNPTALLSS